MEGQNGEEKGVGWGGEGGEVKYAKENTKPCAFHPNLLTSLRIMPRQWVSVRIASTFTVAMGSLTQCI